ncbi:hypothetical protein [Streptomyces lydicus]|uniref:hypothetical protein n=1 Tax=Streptomyces lydicus TaxID=47763 RepID=UPI001012C040|nr:hypothetical protein [Streptomyces lydicus]MCZ1012053.1 hypothetical protein [Streptomyces lydicus]
MTNTPELIALFDGTCVRIRVDRDRHETRVAIADRRDTDGPVLTVAQFNPSCGDGQVPAGWIVSRASSDHYSEPITSEYEALKLLDVATRAEQRLRRTYPNIYPDVPPAARARICRDYPELRRLNQSG